MFVSGSFLVENTVYKIEGVRGEYEQQGAEAAYVESDWRHAVAVRNGRVYCNGLGERGELASRILWLDAQGRPGKYGYMKQILRVYRVAPHAR